MDALLHVLKTQAVHRTALEKRIPNKKLSTHTSSASLLKIKLNLKKVQQTVSILLDVRTVRTVEEDSPPKVYESKECSDWITESKLWIKRFQLMTSKLNEIDRKLHQIVDDTIKIHNKSNNECNKISTAYMDTSLPSIVQQFPSSESTTAVLNEIYNSEIYRKTLISVIQSRDRWKKLKSEINGRKGCSKLFSRLRYVLFICIKIIKIV